MGELGRRSGLAAVGLLVAVPFVLGAAASDERSVPDLVWRFSDPGIVESSGLVVGDDLVVTANDSGDTGRVFAVDRRTGDTVGVTTWDDDPDDVEALAPAGDGEVWVADIGDNTRARDDVAVTRVPVGPGDRTVGRPAFGLRYPDGSTDAEALLAHPVTGRLYLVSKTIVGGTVYAAPRRLDTGQPNLLRAIGTVGGLVTDAAFFSDGRHVIVRGYTRAVVYSFPALELVGSFDLPPQQQGEGIAVSAEGSVFASSEGLRSPLLRITLPDGVRREVASADPTTGPTPAAPVPDAPGGEDVSVSPADHQDEGWGIPVWWVVGSAVAMACVAALVVRRRRAD